MACESAFLTHLHEVNSVQVETYVRLCHLHMDDADGSL